jgi:tRNA pseudouridine32 synthase/23S rRNA pseudouridine746 synthase
MEVLFENRDYLAIHKPENLASIPERLKGPESLLRLLEQARGEKLFVVHRLDKEVSGVIVFARNADAHRYLNERFSGREVRKVYLALLHGVIQAPGGSISKPIRQFGSGRMGVDHRGKPSRTDFEVQERIEGFTFVRAFPQTGRRHQLRVHFYSIGHPVVGDRRYGEQSLQVKFPRLMLHAQQIAFALPSGEALKVEAHPPPSFQDCLERLRRAPSRGGSGTDLKAEAGRS